MTRQTDYAYDITEEQLRAYLRVSDIDRLTMILGRERPVAHQCYAKPVRVATAEHGCG